MIKKTIKLFVNIGVFSLRFCKGFSQMENYYNVSKNNMINSIFGIKLVKCKNLGFCLQLA